MKGGHAARVLFPENTSEVAEALAEATQERTPVTVAEVARRATCERDARADAPVPCGQLVMGVLEAHVRAAGRRFIAPNRARP